MKGLVRLGQEEFFDVFEMVPRTVQDVYNQKLLAGTHKPALVSTRDDDVEKDTQTDDFGQADKYNQAPDDVMTAYNAGADTKTKKQRKTNEALALEKFMARAGPVMEQIVEENSRLWQSVGTDKQKHAAVELKQTLQFPQDVLVMLGTQDQPASVLAVTALHLFESAPQSKCAVAYEVVSPREELGLLYLIIVYSITANQVLRIMKSESEVTKICTPADDQILIAGTNVGSLVVYDLTAFESSAISSDFFDYEAILFRWMQEGMDADDNMNHQKALK